MIIFDLDGTLADCEHRRHFVDPSKNPHLMQDIYSSYADGRWWDTEHYEKHHTAIEWKPNWQAFYEACDKDKPIESTINLLNILIRDDHEIRIWSARCESVRDKTISWLKQQLDIDAWFYRDCLKMRPIGDNTPDEVLKEKWLEETYEETQGGRRTPIQFVFDARPKVMRMWRTHGIFVFNCCQHENEF